MAKYVIDTDRFIPEIKELFVFGLCVDDTITTPSNIRHIGEPLTPEYVKEHFGDLHEGEYEVAYQNGLNDAWKAARAIGHNSEMGLRDAGFVFEKDANPYNPSWYVVMKYTAYQAIAKLAAYEQKQKEDSKIIEPIADINENIKELALEAGRILRELHDAIEKMKGGAE